MKIRSRSALSVKLAHCSALVSLLSFAGANGYAQDRGMQQQDNGAFLPLPYGIDRLVAIDAHNLLIAQLMPQDDDSGIDSSADLFRGISVNHVYAGGIARIFGGAVFPAEPFISPAFNGNTFNGNAFNRNAAPQNSNVFSSQPSFRSPTDQASNNPFLQGTVNR